MYRAPLIPASVPRSIYTIRNYLLAELVIILSGDLVLRQKQATMS